MGLRRQNLTQRSHRFWQVVFVALVLLAVLLVLRGLQAVLAPVAAALVLSYLLDPAVSWLDRRFGIPRWGGTLLLFFGALLVTAGVVLVAVPVMVRELLAFGEAVPTYVQRVREAVVPWVEQTFGIVVPKTLTQLSDQFGSDAKELASQALRPLGGMAGRLARGTAGVLSLLGTLLLIPVFTFYFLPKFPQIVVGAGELIPRRYYPWVEATVVEIDAVLAAWIRGQLTVIAVLMVLYSVGLSLAGLKLAVLIGSLTGLLAFIPYVGVSIGVVLSLLVSLLEYSGTGQLIGVVAVFGVVQAFEGLVLTPYLVGEKVGLGPVGVLLALMIGGNLFGFVGVLLAVPTAAALAVVIRRSLASYRRSAFYRRGERDPTPDGDEAPCAESRS
jgi:predicted PurR-regulated permease PerM